MDVKLINMSTNDPLGVIWLAGHVCREKDANQLFKDFKNFKPTANEMQSYCKKIIAAGHESVLEHVSFSFLIIGISRVCSHQLVRHRIASFCQLSHRIEDENISVEYYATPSNNKEVSEYILQATKLYKKLIKDGISPDKARYILPAGIHTNIFMTMNLRELRHFLKLRLVGETGEPSSEIKELAFQIYDLVEEVIPEAFFDMNVPGKTIV